MADKRASDFVVVNATQQWMRELIRMSLPDLVVDLEAEIPGVSKRTAMFVAAVQDD